MKIFKMMAVRFLPLSQISEIKNIQAHIFLKKLFHLKVGYEKKTMHVHFIYISK